uniref:Uncharacterized protein n=1 Tax=Arundo donax TaxID=35708 RepID=A0A0A9H7E5_ARUDO
MPRRATLRFQVTDFSEADGLGVAFAARCEARRCKARRPTAPAACHRSYGRRCRNRAAPRGHPTCCGTVRSTQPYRFVQRRQESHQQ